MRNRNRIAGWLVTALAAVLLSAPLVSSPAMAAENCGVLEWRCSPPPDCGLLGLFCPPLPDDCGLLGQFCPAPVRQPVRVPHQFHHSHR